MEPRTIVAIEIASSKIKGGVAAVAPDGSISVLAVEEIPGTNNVRYGRIQNIREVSGAVNEIIRRLEGAPAIAPRTVEAMCVSLGGRSLSAEPAKAALKFPHECEITENQVKRLEHEATRDFMGDKNIEDMVPRMFYVNNASMRKAVGTFGETLRGEFMMLTCGKETRQNLDRLKYDSVNPENVVYILRPTAIADFVLTSDERQLGCALVDFGAETTTVSLYKDGSLAFLSTIPMGSRLINLDLMAGLGITEEAAENYKITIGSMSADASGSNPNAEEINAYIRARAGEIIANILNQIERSGYVPQNIVLVGGGSKLADFPSMMSTQLKMPVRVAEMPAGVTFRVPGRNNADNIDIVALLAAGARRLDRTCICRPAPEIVPEVEQEAQDEPTAEEVADRFRKDSRREIQPEQSKPVRKPVADDDDLLDDDPDEDETEEEEVNERPRKRRGFFSFGRKHKEEPEPEYDEEEEYDQSDEYESDDEDPYDPESDDDHFTETKNALNGIRNRFANFWKSNGNDDDDEN